MLNSYFRQTGLIFIAAAMLPCFSHAASIEDIHATTKEKPFRTVRVSDAELDKSRGAFLPSSLNLVTSNLTANNSNNSVVVNGDLNTGNNFVGGSAFNNSSGIVSIIQNSGNQVNIQNSTQLNVVFAAH